MYQDRYDDDDADEISSVARILRFFSVIILAAVVIVIAIIIYPEIQKYFFDQDGSLFFLDNSKNAVVYILIAAITPYVAKLSYNILTWRRETVEFYTLLTGKVMIVSLMLSASVYYLTMNCYSYLCTDKVIVKAGIFDDQVEYGYDDIEYVNVGTHYSDSRHKIYKIDVDYILHFNDGSEIDLAGSDDFWIGISSVDDHLKLMDVEITREKIGNREFFDMMIYHSGCDFKSFLETIGNLFEYNNPDYEVYYGNTD